MKRIQARAELPELFMEVDVRDSPPLFIVRKKHIKYVSVRKFCGKLIVFSCLEVIVVTIKVKCHLQSLNGSS